jgi:outer membrane protein TolC
MWTTTVLLAALAAAAPETLTLEGALAEAERASPDLAQARARVEQARAQVARARAGYLPQLRGGASYTRFSEEAIIRLPSRFVIQGGEVVPAGIVEATVQAQDQLAAQIDLQQAIFAPQVWFAVEGAGAGARAAGEQLESARQELRLGVAQAYYAASAASQAVLVAERQLAVARAHEKDSEVQVEAGVAPRITLLRAEIERTRAEQDLTRAENAVASAKSALAALLGRPDAAAFALTPPAPPALPPDLGALEDEAVQRRPDLAAARSAIEAAQARRKGATAGYLPTLGAFGQARWTNVEGFTGSNEIWSAGLALSWNIFDGGAREAERRESGARIAETEAARESAVNRARDEVRRARLDLESARANRAKAEEEVRLAGENQRLVETAFKAGAASSLEATDANAGLATAEIGLVREGLNADVAALQLLRAAGLFGGR